MLHRIRVWREYKQFSHVLSDGLRLNFIPTSYYRLTHQTPSSIKTVIKHHELEMMLMGRPCGWKEMRRQIINLLLLVAALLVGLSLME